MLLYSYTAIYIYSVYIYCNILSTAAYIYMMYSYTSAYILGVFIYCIYYSIYILYFLILWHIFILFIFFGGRFVFSQSKWNEMNTKSTVLSQQQHQLQQKFQQTPTAASPSISKAKITSSSAFGNF